MAIKDAQDLFIEELRDTYSAEKQAVRSYPRLAKAISSPELKEAVQEHMSQTKAQIERLDRVFEILEKRSSGKTCEGMKGLLEEAAEHVEEIEKGPLLDMALIGALQRVEHYEMAAYGTVATLAEAMGQEEIHELLGATLAEEKDTDGKLTEISHTVNSEALAEGEDEEPEEEDEEEEDARPAKKPAKKSAAKGSSKGKKK